MQLVDTHCHIHFKEFGFVPDEVIKNAVEASVTKMICVGCSLEDSIKAQEFATKHNNVWASVGAHPHDGANFLESSDSVKKLRDLAQKEKVVAIGEIGLDYFRSRVDKNDQKKSFISQIEATIDLELPYIFHIRDAWADFWEILDDYSGISGVVHSFSSDTKNLEEALSRGFYIGLNGIMTFTKDQAQLEAAKLAPLNRLVIETDAPFLTPVPYRGRTCEPKHIKNIADFLAELRDENIDKLADNTTKNAERLFGI